MDEDKETIEAPSMCVAGRCAAGDPPRNSILRPEVLSPAEAARGAVLVGVGQEPTRPEDLAGESPRIDARSASGSSS